MLTAGILWGCMGLFVRPLDRKGLSSWDIVFLRAVLTTVIMFVVLLVKDRRLFRIRLKDLWCFAGTGLLSIVFFNLCYFKEITLTSLSVAAILLYTAPAWVMLLSAVIFRERLTRWKMLALALSFAGLIFVTGVLGGGERLTWQTALTYTLGLKGVENGQASIIASVEPVVATLNGILWFHEKLTYAVFLGAALVLAGIVIANRGTYEERREDQCDAGAGGEEDRL